MSADREFRIYVKEENSNRFSCKEDEGAYGLIAQIIEDENSGFQYLSEELEAKNKQSYEEALEGQGTYFFTKECYLLDFLDNIEKFDLMNKYLDSNAGDDTLPFGNDENESIGTYQNKEIKDFLDICFKYKNLPKEHVYITYCVTS